MLIPSGLSSKTAFMAERVLGNVVSSGIKVLVLAVIIGIGSARVQARNWRAMAFASLLLAGGFAAALVWQSARGTVVPWVVEVDQLGKAQLVAPADADYRTTDPQIAWHLARFMTEVRSIPADPIVVRQNWLRANPLGIYINAISWSREMAQ